MKIQPEPTEHEPPEPGLMGELRNAAEYHHNRYLSALRAIEILEQHPEAAELTNFLRFVPRC